MSALVEMFVRLIVQADEDGLLRSAPSSVFDSIVESVKVADAVVRDWAGKSASSGAFYPIDDVRSELMRSSDQVVDAVHDLEVDPTKEWTTLLEQQQALNEAFRLKYSPVDDLRVSIASQRAQNRELHERLETATKAVERAEVAATKSESASSKAVAAASETGSNTFRKSFQTYAKEQTESAAVFRGWTIAMLTAAILVGVMFVFGWDTRVLGTTPANEWHSVAYRLAILGGLAALAGYLGRQAGHHRRNGDWATAMDVQLQAFPGFVAPVEDRNTQNAIYLAFSARVLGAPPDVKEQNASATPSTQALLDLILTEARRRTGQ